MSRCIKQVFAFLRIFAQPFVVFRDGILVAVGNGGGLACARVRGGAVPLQLELDPADSVEQFPMHALDLGGVAGEAMRIEIAHLPGEFGHVFGHLRIALQHLPKLAETYHVLLEAALCIGGISRGIGGHALLPHAAVGVVAGVEVVPHCAVGSATVARFADGAAHVAISAQPASRAAAIGAEPAQARSLASLLAIWRKLRVEPARPITAGRGLRARLGTGLRAGLGAGPSVLRGLIIP